MQSKGKLFIQIPCLNEESTIKAVIKSIPKKEFKELGLLVKILVIDDASSDQTANIAIKSGADFLIKHNKTMGLAKSFKDGINFCLSKGADIIVNTDGDNQYDQQELVKLVKPILSGEADLVIGDRQIEKLRFMSPGKKLGNMVGSNIIRFLTGKKIPDASSGIRAMSGSIAKTFNLMSSHTYTHETIIQASNHGAEILSLPVKFKKRNFGESRLITDGVLNHINKSMVTIIRAILLYKAFKYLLILGSFIMVVGILIGFRFVYFFTIGLGTGHIQSLVLSSVLINIGFMTIILGFIADLISVNRKTLEEIKSKIKP